MNEPKVLYDKMFECIDYGEYDLAMEYAIALDHIIGMRYYAMIVENLIRDKDDFIRKLGK